MNNQKNIELLSLEKFLIIDVGSNDGTLLNEYKIRNEGGWREPTNVAKYANARGIKTIQAPLIIKFQKNYSKIWQSKTYNCYQCICPYVFTR